MSELQQAWPTLTPQERLAIETIVSLKSKMRPKQRRPQTSKNTILYLAGRGFGKTFAGAANTIIQALAGKKQRIAIIAPTYGDLVKVCLQGESGLLGLLPPSLIVNYDKQDQVIDLFNGTRIEGYTGERPSRLRGPQFSFAWIDELAAMMYQQDVFDMLSFGLRLGDHPQCLITTTPRPTKLIKQLNKDAEVIRGSTYENKDNLASSFIKAIEDRYAGTRLGRQESDAEIIEDVDGALWNYSMIDYADPPEQLKRIVIGVDPAVTKTASSDETGIVVAAQAHDETIYILEDASFKGTPREWALKVANLYDVYKADRIITEVNQGGDMVRSVLSSVRANLPITEVRATRGKYVRAEPVASLYEQGRVKHKKPMPILEEQMTNFTGASSDSSPDRLDALVWALTDLMGKAPKVVNVTII